MAKQILVRHAYPTAFLGPMNAVHERVAAENVALITRNAA
jgi:hypothetical protein